MSASRMRESSTALAVRSSSIARIRTQRVAEGPDVSGVADVLDLGGQGAKCVSEETWTLI